MTAFADDAKWYRLKESTRNEYMNVASFDASYENNARGLVNIAPYAESDAQIFTMEDAGDGKVYLRTKNDYYVTCGAWNVNVSPSAKEALIFEETSVDGATAYYIHASSQASKGFKIGGVSDGNGGFSQDYYVYCDAPQDLWAKWILEEVAAEPAPEPIDFDWTGTYNVSATVSNAMPDAYACPETFTMKVEYNEGYGMYLVTEIMGNNIVNLNSGGLLLTIADDNRSAVISYGYYDYGIVSKVDDYGYAVIASAENGPITLTVNEDGTVSADDITIGYSVYENGWSYQMALSNLTNVTAEKATVAEPDAEVLELLQALLSLEGVGYPNDAARAEFQAAIDAYTANASSDNYNALSTALNAYYATSEVVLPTDGKYYSITAVGYSDKEFYFDFNGTEIVLVERTDETVLPESAKFKFEALDGGSYRIWADDSNYLVYSHNDGYAPSWMTVFSTTGVQNVNDANAVAEMGNITLSRIAVGGNVNAESADLFGLMQWNSARGVRTDNGSFEPGCLVINEDTPDFDASNSPFYKNHNGKNLTSALRIEEVAVTEPEEPAGFEWASKTEVMVPAEGYYSEILGTMYTLTATVSVEADASVAAPESFDFGLGYYPGYDDGAGYKVDPYFYVGYVNNQRGGSYYTNMPLVIAEDGKSAVITLQSTYIGSQLYMYDAQGQKTTLTLTLNENGTISMSDFVVSDMDGFKVATYTNVVLTKKVILPPTELTVKGYSPKKEVTSLETIEITFSDSIVSRISGSTGILRPDGQTEYFMNREMVGNTLRLTLNPAQTAEGTYTLTIPAGVIKNAEGLEYAGGEFTFTVKQPKYLVGEIDPADKSSVESLSRIVFTYAEGTSIYANNSEQITVTDKDGNSVSTAEYNYTGLGWNQVGVKLNTPITTVGTYTVTIPEGLMYDYGSGDISPAYTLTYTIEEPKEPEPATEYTHHEGTNRHAGRALTTFTIANLDTEATLTVSDIQVVNAKSPIYVDKTDNVLEVQPGNTIYFEQFGFAGEWMHAYAYIDYNNDFVFGTDLNIDGDTEGELVSHNFYSATDAEWGTTSRGQEVKNGNANNTNSYDGSQGLPHFTLPADLAAGDYRLRIKTDWNNLDPNFVGHSQQNNPENIGACQVDIILRVVADEPAKNYIALVSETTATVGVLDAVVLEFDRWVQENVQGVDVKDADGNVVTTAAFGWKKPDGTTVGDTELVLTLATAITEAGVYTITLPENSVWDYVDGIAETTLTFTVDPSLVETGIDAVDAEGEQVIYDVTGRRVEKISRPGLYIVNGVKVLVK